MSGNRANERGRPFTGADDPRRWKEGRGRGKLSIPDTLRRILAEPVSDQDGRTKHEAMLRHVVDLALSGECWAIKWIADRTEGTALQRVVDETPNEQQTSLEAVLKKYGEVIKTLPLRTSG